MFSAEQLRYLSELAIDAALTAGQFIQTAMSKDWPIEHKTDKDSLAAQVVTAVDRQAQQLIIDCLQAVSHAHDIALLAEETADNLQRLKKPAFWSIDPLDGTLAFIRKQAGFHVSIALVKQNGQPLLGVVYDPMAARLYHSIAQQGCFIDRQAVQLQALDRTRNLRLCTDISFAKDPRYQQTEKVLQQMALALNLPAAEIDLQIGAVNNACQVLQDSNTVYFKYPRQGNTGGSLWDYAATAALLLEAGAVATDIYGQAMQLNRKDSTYMNHRGILFAANHQIALGVQKLAGAINQPAQN